MLQALKILLIQDSSKFLRTLQTLQTLKTNSLLGSNPK